MDIDSLIEGATSPSHQDKEGRIGFSTILGLLILIAAYVGFRIDSSRISREMCRLPEIKSLFGEIENVQTPWIPSAVSFRDNPASYTENGYDYKYKIVGRKRTDTVIVHKEWYSKGVLRITLGDYYPRREFIYSGPLPR